MANSDKLKFIDKFGTENYNKFIKLKNRLAHFSSTDLTWHMKHTDPNKLLDLLSRAEHREYKSGVSQKLDINHRLIPIPVNSKQIIYNKNGNIIWRIYDYTDMIDIASDKYGSEICEWCISGRRKIPLGEVKVSQARSYFRDYCKMYNLSYFDVLITKSGVKYCFVVTANTATKLNAGLDDINSDLIDNICWDRYNNPIGRKILFDNIIDQDILDFYNIYKPVDEPIQKAIISDITPADIVDIFIPEFSEHLQTDKDLSDTFPYKVLKSNSDYLCKYKNDLATLDKHGNLTANKILVRIRYCIKVNKNIDYNLFDLVEICNERYYYIGDNKFLAVHTDCII